MIPTTKQIQAQLRRHQKLKKSVTCPKCNGEGYWTTERGYQMSLDEVCYECGGDHSLGRVGSGMVKRYPLKVHEKEEELLLLALEASKEKDKCLKKVLELKSKISGLKWPRPNLSQVRNL